MKKVLLLALLPLTIFAAVPSQLRCEFLTDPICVDTAAPRVSWQVADPHPGARQTAYQIQAARSLENLNAGAAELWDSGKVASDQAHLVAYAGQPLASRERVWWRVRTWDENGQGGEWSAPAHFELALLNSNDWKATWIAAPRFGTVRDEVTALWARMVVIPTATNPQLTGVKSEVKRELQAKWAKRLDEVAPAPLLRKSFVLPGKVKVARLYLCGLGFHELTINGRRVDDFMMPPAESHYSEYAFYVARDVTAALREGENVIGVLLGGGRYNEKLTFARQAYGEDLPLIAQLEVETDHGQVMVVSDATWQCAPSPLVKNQFWVSEAYDARREISGWDAPGFDATTWKPAKVVPPPTKRLAVQQIPQERVVRRVRPVAVTNPHPGVWVFDMGELMVGCAELNVRAAAGTVLAMRYGEQIFRTIKNYNPLQHGSLLHYDGFENLAPIPGMLSAKTRGNGIMDDAAKEHPGYHALVPADVYVARGAAEGETWHARFAYHPFRYVELIGYPGTPTADLLTGLVVHTALAATGSFESSDPMLNQLHEAAVHSADYTTHGSVNDNAGTEKQNGLTPAIASGAGSVFFRDVEPLWRKVLTDMQAVTRPDMVPRGLGSSMRAVTGELTQSPIWTRQGVELPWYLRLHLGDHETMTVFYPFMKAYVDHFTRNFVNKGELPADPFGDHIDLFTAVGKVTPTMQLTDKKLAGAAYVIGMTRTTAEAAKLLGKANDAAHFTELADRMTAKFNESWFIPERNSYGRRPPAEQFTVQGGNSLALYFGLVPADKRQAVLDALVRDVESWNGISTAMAATYPLLDVLARNGHANLALKVFTQTNYPGPGHSLTFGTQTLPELWAGPNGPAYASLVQSEYVWLARWFYTILGGINPDPVAPGFKHFFLAPIMPEKLMFVRCQTGTPYGDIVSAWKRAENTIRWNVTVPWNTTATVQLPLTQGVRLNGQPVSCAGKAIMFNVDPGNWMMEIDVPASVASTR